MSFSTIMGFLNICGGDACRLRNRRAMYCNYCTQVKSGAITCVHYSTVVLECQFADLQNSASTTSQLVSQNVSSPVSK